MYDYLYDDVKHKDSNNLVNINEEENNILVLNKNNSLINNKHPIL